jgi:hypothetical protein
MCSPRVKQTTLWGVGVDLIQCASCGHTMHTGLARPVGQLGRYSPWVNLCGKFELELEQCSSDQACRKSAVRNVRPRRERRSGWSLHRNHLMHTRLSISPRSTAQLAHLKH